MKVFSVAGYHHTGKTTAVVNIIKELRKRGYSVESIKDIHAEKFTMEKEGSNSWKHWEASDSTVIARGMKETYQIWHRRLELNEMLEHLTADYVVVEGMKSAALPHIICAKDEDQLAELVDETTFGISGIYADDHTEYKNFTVFKSDNVVAKMVDLIEEKVFDVLPNVEPECCSKCGYDCCQMVGKILSGEKTRAACITDQAEIVELTVGGKTISLVPFVQRILADTLTSLVHNFDGCKKGDIQITLREKKK